jgi:FlaG/FlaF family flagellin (archaellin)
MNKIIRLLLIGMVSILTAQTATIKNSIIGYTTISEEYNPEGSDDRNGDQ